MWYGFKLKPEVKEAWLKDLRSGEYKKGKGYLKFVYEHKNGKKETRYCCMGVLSEGQKVESRLRGSPVCHTDEGKQLASFDYSNHDSDVYMPNMEWFEGLFDERGKVFSQTIEDLADKLAGMNDGNQSFKKIADWIERNL